MKEKNEQKKHTIFLIRMVFSQPINGRSSLRPPSSDSLYIFIDDGDNYNVIERIQFDNQLYLGIF